MIDRFIRTLRMVSASGLLAAATGVAGVAGISGCASAPRADKPASPSSSSSLPPAAAATPAPLMPAISDEPYAGPETTVQILTRYYRNQPRSVAVIEVIARTGGHRLTLDESIVRDGTANLFLTLAQPGFDEAVTQALVPHHVAFEYEEGEFKQAMAYVQLIRRGEPGGDSGYRLAATAP